MKRWSTFLVFVTLFAMLALPAQAAPAGPFGQVMRRTNAVTQGKPNARLYAARAKTPQGLGWLYLTLFDDGSFYKDLPSGGLEGFDPEISRRLVPEKWGTYSTISSGLQIVMVNSNGARTIGSVKNGVLGLDGWEYMSVPDPAGRQITGAYSNRFDGAGDDWIIFTSDGQFYMLGAPFEARVASQGKLRYGTYRTMHFSILLTFAGGQSEQTSFFMPPNDVGAGSRQLLVIGGKDMWLQSTVEAPRTSVPPRPTEVPTKDTPIATVLNLNGLWSAGGPQTARILDVGHNSLNVSMHAFHRPTAHGSILTITTITVTFPDDKTYTGTLQAPDTIRWSNGTVWKRVGDTEG